MHSVIAGYAKAIKELGQKPLQDLVAKKEKLEFCLSDRDFCEVLAHPFLSAEEKVSFVIECLGGVDEKIKALFLMMANNDRLPLLGELIRKIEMDLNLGGCKGILYSYEKINPTLLELFKTQLEKKIGYQIHIDEVLWGKQETKCVIDSLGLEISFSKESFDRDLRNFVLDSFR